MKRLNPSTPSRRKALRSRSNVYEPSDRLLRSSQVKKDVLSSQSLEDLIPSECSVKVNFEKLLEKDEYILHYLRFMQNLEEKSYPKLMAHPAKALMGETRCNVVNWLILLHVRLKLRQETLLFSVDLLDLVLARKAINADRIQLYALSATWISTKINEVRSIDVADLQRSASNRYRKRTICRCEQFILNLVRFRLMLPVSLHFTYILIAALDLEEDENGERLFYTSSYLVDTLLPHRSYLSLTPSLVAAASIYASYMLVYDFTFRWPEGLRQLTCYTEDDLKPVSRLMLQEVAEAPTSDLRESYLKYKSEKTLGISLCSWIQPSAVKTLLNYRFSSC